MGEGREIGRQRDENPLLLRRTSRVIHAPSEFERTVQGPSSFENAHLLSHSREHAPLDSRPWTHPECSFGEEQHPRGTRSLRSVGFGDVPICFVCIPCGFQLVGGSVCIDRVRPMDITDVRWDVTSAWQRTEGASSTRTHPRTSRIRVPTPAIRPLRHILIAVLPPSPSFPWMEKKLPSRASR